MKINGIPRALLQPAANQSNVPSGLTAQEVRNGFERMFRGQGFSRSQARAKLAGLAEAVRATERFRAGPDQMLAADEAKALMGLLASLRG